MLNRTKTPYATLRKFVEPYAVAHPAAPADSVIDLDNPQPSSGADLPARLAIEFLADVYEQDGGPEVKKAVEVRDSLRLREADGAQLYTSLGIEHDKIRKRYWDFRSREAQKHAPVAA